MKKRFMAGMLMVVLAAIGGIGLRLPQAFPTAADDVYHYRGWNGPVFKNYTAGPLPTDAATQKAQAELEAEIDAADSSYDRVAALLEKQTTQNKAKTYTGARLQSDGTNGYRSLEYLITTGGYRVPSSSGTPQQPTTPSPQPTPTTNPTVPTIPTPTTPTSTPTPVPTQAPTPTIPEPVNTVEYSTPTDYAFHSTSDQWVEVWYTTSSLMYLRGSVPEDCDTNSRDCWQLVFDLDGKEVSIQGDGCVDGQGTSLDVGFMFDSDVQAEIESHFINGGGNIPITFQYRKGGQTQTLTLAGQPGLSLCYNGYELKLYVTR